MKNLGVKNIKLLLTQLFCLLLVVNTYSQTVYTRYFVAFTDKNNSNYSTGNPQQFLSQRAINRRGNQGIAVNNEDIPVDTAYVKRVAKTGALVMCRTKWFNGVVVRLTNQAQLDSINALPFVLSSKPLAKVKSPKKFIPTAQNITSNEKNAATQTDVFDYGLSKNQVYMLNGQCLHNQGYNGTGMQIGIIDDGFLNAKTGSVFDTLWHNHQVIAAHDFLTDDSLVFNEGGHGTEVLSCIAANTPGQMIGTSPYAKFYLLRSEIDSTEKIVEEYQWVAAIEYADSAGADVINSSLGYTIFDDPTQSHTWADLNGRTSVASLSATMAARRGMISCIAAGNEGGSSWQKISVPSDADSILAVGAVDASGAYATFSSTGNSADGRIKPDVAAQGSSSTIFNVNSGNVSTGSGTSFASPIMAGMVTCLWQGNPTKTNMQVINAIKQSATQYANPDSILGYGIPDFCVADQILKGTFAIKSLVASNIINTLCGSNDCLLTVNVYDVAGRLVLSTQTKSSQNNSTDKIIQSLDLSTVTGGMYVVKISSSNGNSYTKKLVKS
ncbi:MAG TPA: S8 family serine peptidase [Bacteroidia bacterium]|nr:S8 family serine peptidase [Bacteroidia bacterium]